MGFSLNNRCSFRANKGSAFVAVEKLYDFKFRFESSFRSSERENCNICLVSLFICEFTSDEKREIYI